MINALSPITLNKWGLPDINGKTQQTDVQEVFVGGDLGGYSGTTVESVNDGKTAAWFMHCQMQVKYIFKIQNNFTQYINF